MILTDVYYTVKKLLVDNGFVVSESSPQLTQDTLYILRLPLCTEQTENTYNTSTETVTINVSITGADSGTVMLIADETNDLILGSSTEFDFNVASIVLTESNFQHDPKSTFPAPNIVNTYQLTTIQRR